MSGGKHAAPSTAYWAAGMTQEQIIAAYRELHSKQVPPCPFKAITAKWLRACAGKHPDWPRLPKPKNA
jgi:hypothetical protein